MMLEFVREAQLTILMYDDENFHNFYFNHKKKEWEEEAIERFEKEDFNRLIIEHNDYKIKFYIENFLPDDEIKNLEIKVNDEEIFNKLLKQFSKYRRCTDCKIDKRYELTPCIDEYLRDWFC